MECTAKVADYVDYNSLDIHILQKFMFMNCPNCQITNPENARFCMNCGYALQISCPNCGTMLLLSARFCFNCGYQFDKATQVKTPTTSSASADLVEHQLDRYIPKQLLSKLESARQSGLMEGERRIVTMLFCDVKGSTAAASRLDPEEWAEIINNAFEHLIGPVYRYEGIVARLMGDGLLAFFGAPLAHEDDPQRAVLAGLEIIENIKPYCESVSKQWEFGFDVRVGINTGLVVVGGVGSDLRMEYTALGDAINIAARMEQTAQPGTVQVSEATYKLIAPLFEFEDLGGIQVKGKDDPVRSYRVLNLRSDPGSLRGIQGLDSPMVGRHLELLQLKDTLEQLRKGRGQIISITGEAGMGKSRLLAELKKETVQTGAERSIYWMEGRSLSYEITSPYAPFKYLLINCIETESRKSSHLEYTRLEKYIKKYLPGDALEIAPFIGSMLGLALEGEALQRVKYLEPPQLRSGIFQSVARLIEAITSRIPVMLVMDDLHWIDKTSLEMLEHLFPLVDRNSLIIIGVYRPRKDEPSWRFHKIAGQEYPQRHMVIRLEPLPEDQARQLVANLLNVEDLSEKIRQLILSKAEGNPFFVEEVIRSLMETNLIVRRDGHWFSTLDIEDIAVPDTLAAVITARLDRLPESSKRTAQTAAVIGRHFQYDELAAILDDSDEIENSLLELLRREILREKSRFPQREYIFKHALTQETAYHSLLLKKRKKLHGSVAEYLETFFPERINEIARHYQEARLPQKALPYLVLSGEQAAHAYATPEATRYFEQAIKISEKVEEPGLQRRAYEGLGSVLIFTNQITRAIETYNTMLGLAEKRGDAPMQVSALNKLSFVTALRMGEFDQAQSFIAESDRLARQNNDKAGLSELSLVRCMMCTAVADFDSVVHYMGETINFSRELEADEMLSLALTHVASSQAFMLSFEDATMTFEEGLNFNRQIGDREHEAENLAMTGFVLHLRRGDLDSARQSAEAGVSIAEAIGATYQLADGLRHMGIIFLMKGQYEKALETFQRYLRIAREAELPWYIADALCLLGTAYIKISPRFSELALEYHAQAAQAMKAPSGVMLGGTDWIELGDCALEVGDLERAKEYYENALTIPTITSNLEKPRLLVRIASVSIIENDLEKAGQLISEARIFVEKHDLKFHEPLVILGDAELASRLEHWQAALDHYTLAERSANSMGMLPLVLVSRKEGAGILTILSREEEARSMRESAQEIVDEIAGYFTNPDLRDEFLAAQLEKIV